MIALGGDEDIVGFAVFDGVNGPAAFLAKQIVVLGGRLLDELVPRISFLVKSPLKMLGRMMLR